MTEWTPNLNTKTAVEDFLDTFLRTLPDLIGIDEIISGCRIVSVDPYGVGVGTYPRYMRAALRDGYYNDVWYRGNIELAVNDFCTVIHIKDGDRYEIVWTSGSAGVDVIVGIPDHTHIAGDGGVNLLPDRVAVDATLADQDGVIALGETADPSEHAGEGMLYCKNVMGVTRLYFRRDDGEIIELGAGVTDHGMLAGLADDDHPQYLLADGTRAVTGPMTTQSLIPDFDARTLGDAAHTYDLYTEVVAHFGATGNNFVVLPDNLADGLHFADLGGLATHYLTFVSTNGAREVVINQQADSYIDFRVEGDAQTHLLFADASANHVGIGEPVPLARLHVAGDAIFDTASGTDPLWITRLGAVDQAAKFFVDDAKLVIESIQDETSGYYGSMTIRLGSHVGQAPNFIISDYRSGADVMRLHMDVDTGNLGIGITPGANKFYVWGGDSAFRHDHTNASATVVTAYGIKTITANTTKYSKAIDATIKPVISAGITDLGYACGMWMQSARTAGVTDVGTLRFEYALMGSYGHYATHANAVTTYSYGLQLVAYTNTGTIINLYGIYQVNANATNYFQGDMGIGDTTPGTKLEVIGTVTATKFTDTGGGYDFFMPNPANPSEEMLRHWGIETDGLRTIYGGKAIIGQDGTATIHLPDWVAALNDVKSCVYSLAPIGDYALLYVSKEMNSQGQQCNFEVTGNPKQHFSWIVIVDRKDTMAVDTLAKHPVVEARIDCPQHVKEVWNKFSPPALQKRRPVHMVPIRVDIPKGRALEQVPKRCRTGKMVHSGYELKNGKVIERMVPELENIPGTFVWQLKDGVKFDNSSGKFYEEGIDEYSD